MDEKQVENIVNQIDDNLPAAAWKKLMIKLAKSFHQELRSSKVGTSKNPSVLDLEKEKSVQESVKTEPSDSESDTEPMSCGSDDFRPEPPVLRSSIKNEPIETITIGRVSFSC